MHMTSNCFVHPGISEVHDKIFRKLNNNNIIIILRHYYYYYSNLGTNLTFSSRCSSLRCRWRFKSPGCQPTSTGKAYQHFEGSSQLRGPIWCKVPEGLNLHLYLWVLVLLRGTVWTSLKCFISHI